MKISELITSSVKVLKEKGDLDVKICLCSVYDCLSFDDNIIMFANNNHVDIVSNIDDINKFKKDIRSLTNMERG